MAISLLDASPNTTLAEPSDLSYTLVTPSVEVVANRPLINLVDRAINKIIPTVTSSQQWVWANGETGTPYFDSSTGEWYVDTPSFDWDNIPVSGSADDTQITFHETSSVSFYFSSTEEDNSIFVFTVDGQEVRQSATYDEELQLYYVDSVIYNGITYHFEEDYIYDDTTGNSYTGEGTINHVVTYTTV
ncbi:MAG: hypothetical protein J6Q22_10930 [Prevotella sp.]|nr:hypothetical protein [Prevotella sp.]